MTQQPTLYRAFAFRSDLLDAPASELQPEVMVFWESATRDACGSTLLRLLGLAWGCGAADVDYYNVDDEHELRRRNADDAPGDAALWVTGQFLGPLFHPAERTLMFVRPLTLERLLRASDAAAPLRTLQRAAELEAASRWRQGQRERNLFVADLSRSLRDQPRAGA